MSSPSQQPFLTRPLQEQWLISAHSLLLSKQRVLAAVGRKAFWALELHKHWLLLPSPVKLSNEISLIGSLWQLNGLVCIKYFPVSEVSNYCFHFPLLFYFLIKIMQLINIIARVKLRPFNFEEKDFLYRVFPLFTLKCPKKQKTEISKRSSFVRPRSLPWPLTLCWKQLSFYFKLWKIAVLENEPFTVLVNPWGFGRTEARELTVSEKD